MINELSQLKMIDDLNTDVLMITDQVCPKKQLPTSGDSWTSHSSNFSLPHLQREQASKSTDNYFLLKGMQKQYSIVS